MEMDMGKPVDVVYLDFQKTFDKVPHWRSPGSPNLGKVLIRHVDGRYLPGLRQRQLPQPVAGYVQDHHNQRLRRLLPLHKQKRSCNTATCVTIRLANFLSRSGAMGSRSFIPTDIGAKAFGRKRRGLPM
ncbi:calcitonin gene-related peptide 1-like isoform X2 [Mobula hypostoma]|uniref:calcitonin gene-related peptide 1-like isoform X2 n=1 Tax=Mobula hypostoma TaxID=723540 RepID=UPI002FC2E964